MYPTSRLLLAALLLAPLCACEEPPDPKPPVEGCDRVPGEDPVIEVNHYGAFGELDTTVWCAIPPQGGAPYAPFGIRVRGVVPLENNGLHTTIEAVDTTTQEVVGSGDFWDAYLCSNVGDNDGYWVKNELHLRFFGYTTEELHGREVALQFDAEGSKGIATTRLTVVLDCVAGD